MLEWLKKQIKGEKEFVVYREADVSNLLAIAIKYRVDLTPTGIKGVYLFDSIIKVANLYNMFHEPPSPYMLSKFTGYKRAEKLVKQYSSLFDAKGDILKEELFELLDAFEYIHKELENYVIFGMNELKRKNDIYLSTS